MHRAHKIKLKPTAAQTVALKKAVGCARFAYNWALAAWQKQYAEFKEGKAEKPDLYSISKLWTQNKPEWAYGSPCNAQQRAVLNVGKAYANFWNRKAKAPAFKKKGKCKDSFYVPNDKLKPRKNRVTLPCIGSVKMTEELRFQGKIMGAHVSCVAGSWFVSIEVDVPAPLPDFNTSVVGVDVGIKSIAVASDGTVLENPKLLKKAAPRLKRLQQALSRTQRDSRRRAKARLKLQRLHRKITDTRSDAIHKFTTALAKNHGTAVIETLDVQEMKDEGTKWMRVLLQDTAMKEVHRQLEYKMRTQHAPPFEPTSKMCSACGAVKDTLDLGCRTYRCKACGAVKDRDANAACNLRNMRWVTPPANVGACPGRR